MVREIQAAVPSWCGCILPGRWAFSFGLWPTSARAAASASDYCASLSALAAPDVCCWIGLGQSYFVRKATAFCTSLYLRRVGTKNPNIGLHLTKPGVTSSPTPSERVITLRSLLPCFWVPSQPPEDYREESGHFANADGKSERNKRCNAKGELRTQGLVPRGFSCEIFELRVNHILDSASCVAQYHHSSSFLLSHLTRVALQSKYSFLHLAGRRFRPIFTRFEALPLALVI